MILADLIATGEVRAIQANGPRAWAIVARLPGAEVEYRRDWSVVAHTWARATVDGVEVTAAVEAAGPHDCPDGWHELVSDRPELWREHTRQDLAKPWPEAGLRIAPCVYCKSHLSIREFLACPHGHRGSIVSRCSRCGEAAVVEGGEIAYGMEVA